MQVVISAWRSRQRTASAGMRPRRCDEPRWRWLSIRSVGYFRCVEQEVRYVGRYVYPFVYLDHAQLRRYDIDPARARRAAGEAALRHAPGVAAYYTADAACSRSGEWRRRFQNSFHALRCGDLMLAYEPGAVERYGSGQGISYGSMYNYDVQTPLLFYGPQFRAHTVESPVDAVDIAPTLARAMRVAAPSSSSGRVLGRCVCAGRERDEVKPGPSLEISFCGINLKNPVLAASGTFAYGVEFERLLDLNALGGLVVKGLSREPMDGNPPPRIWEAEAGMINSIGLQNIGVEAFVRDKLPALAKVRTAVFANVFGYAIEDYVEVVRVLEEAEGLAGYELNVSCPNTTHGGIYLFERSGSAGGSGRGRAGDRAAAGNREAVSECGSHRTAGAGRGRLRRGRDLSGQHVRRAGGGCAHTQSADRRGVRRLVGTGDQAHRAAHGI